MNHTVIKVENLSKQYRLGLVGTGSLGHDLNRWWAKLRGKPDPYLKVGEANDRTQSGDSEYVWALKDINFEVKQGEVLGIIGRNGAGKSTLLKILSRVTAPTIGNVKIKGRIASLLEVGTGFHPELTGRENIYLNGAINGMTRAEVTQKLDEIVNFSGCERYIDTPVKRYSSGMMVRLGFAVAAHLEPEILIVDEVLAVGDAEFQKKCIGKMHDVAGHGRTVLFVSHNMSAVANLCGKVVWIDTGEIKTSGTSHSIIDKYLSNKSNLANTPLEKRSDRKGNGNARLVSIKCSAEQGKSIQLGSDVSCEMKFSVFKQIRSPLFYLGIFDREGTELVHINSRMKNYIFSSIKDDTEIICHMPNIPLPPREYRIDVALLDGNDLVDYLESAVTLYIDEGDFFSSGYLGPAVRGKILLKHEWKVNN